MIDATHETLTQGFEVDSPQEGDSTEFVHRLESSYGDIASSLRLEDSEPGWNNHVNDVIVVLSASRSGSSLIFKALTSTGEVVAPAGEHEPWLTLTKNKYPFKESDQMTGINKRDQLLDYLRNDLLVRAPTVSSEEYARLLWNRQQLRGNQNHRFIQRVMRELECADIVDSEKRLAIVTSLGRISILPPVTRLNQFENEEYSVPVENPPLIDQPVARMASLRDLSSKTLLFKSPSDAYRPGFYESLFPNANIRYIHLSRGFVQTVNGLMDGWQKNDTDFISNPVGISESLKIEDYSITDLSKTYWCFDLFPGWEDYVETRLVEVCANQWLSAHTSILNNFEVDSQLTFEEFYSDPRSFYEKLTAISGVDTTAYDWSDGVMTTEPPSQHRWLKRASLFRDLSKHLPKQLLRDIEEVQAELGYSMEESTWH